MNAQPSKDAALTQDSLKNCLLYLLEHYKKRHTLESLLNSLPLKQNKLTPQIFIRAARRAGLKAQVMDRRAEDISAFTLPAVAYMGSDTAVILKSITKEGAYIVVDCTTHKEIVYSSAADFSKVYGGFLILTKPSAAFEMAADIFSSGGEWFWRVIREFKKIYIQVALAAVFINLMALVSPLFIMNVYDRVVPNAAFETLWVLALGAFTAYIFDFAFRQLRAYFVDIAGKGADILLASRLYQQVLNIRLGQRSGSAGAFANQMREFETLRDFFTSGTLITFIDLPFVFLFLLVIANIGGPIALVPLLAVPLVLIVSYLVQLPLHDLVAKATEDLDAKHGHLVETVNGLETIKSLGMQGHAQGKWEKYVGTTARLGTKTRFLAQLGINFSIFIQNSVTIFLVVWGVYRISGGDMTIGALVACTILVGRTLAPLSQAVGLYVRYQQAKQALTGLDNIMQMDVENPEGKDFVHLKHGLKGRIDFSNVSFAYPGAQLESLTDISFSIKPGEKVGLVGRAGSGKSTLSRLMLNLYNPDKGTILLDGLEIRQLDPTEVRKNMSYVPQNVVLFRGSLRENILLAKPMATEEEFLDAATKSGVIDFAQRHPMGFDLPVGELGASLSGGQRQAVAVARAFLKNSSVVILDDPTSELDNKSEDTVKRYLNAWAKDKTMVLITHRASMLDLVDRLIVIDYGHIVLDGVKKDVLKQLSDGKVKQVKK